MSNSVKLYSNGSAVITKGYRLKGKDPLRVTIPVKKTDLDEVVSSISVLGNVSLPEPPNYTPTNSNPTTLSLDGKSVVKELATKLRGAEATITTTGGKTVVGRVLGVQTYQQETNGSVFEKFRVVMGTKDGVRQVEETEIASLDFTEDFVKSEIAKSLDANFSTIKPDSRNVEVTMIGNADNAEAAISYATPCAAWKTRYVLRLLKGVATIEGQAIVDNDTDDDWNNVNLSVITGEPISFSTDIADIRRPNRSRVNVVSDNATGAVYAEESFGPAIAAAASLCAMPAAAESYGGTLDDCSGGGLESYTPAQQASASVKESGDFSVYTSPSPVTILSRKSAIINLFSLPLDGAKTVLLYKPNANDRRPFTAVKFKNTTTNSLNKGVCEVYVDGDRQGKCVLENTKKGEEAFLIHAVETGVKVLRETGRQESRRNRVKISNGISYCDTLHTQQTTYRVQNSKGEAFQFEIEHTRLWQGGKITATANNGHAAEVSSVDTPSGVRLSLTLPANGYVNVTVNEAFTQQQQFNFDSYMLQSFGNDKALSENKAIQSIIALQKKVDEIQASIDEANTEIDTLTEEQTRLAELIPSVHGDQANTFKTEVGEAEVALKELKKKKLPALTKSLNAAEKEVQAALAKLTLDWSEEAAKSQKNDKK